jgi:pyridoxamine 5'-phosphate oxidase
LQETSLTFDNLNTANEAPSAPLDLFGQWMSEAEKARISYPNAMCVSTIAPHGKPSARIILLKGYDEKGFVFYTNQKSRKADALHSTPRAHLNFFWRELGKQINIEGAVEIVAPQEADEYFSTRPRESQIGAWASQQSHTLDKRSTLISRIKQYEEKYKNVDIPRPPYWSGYRIVPETIEFWSEGDHRLHTRLLYSKTPNGWEKELLYP